MIELAGIARTGLLLVIGLLMMAVLWLLLTGGVRLAGVFNNKVTGSVDPGRIQVLIMTLFIALLMLTDLGEMGRLRQLRLPSNLLLYGFGGSQGLYLVRKVIQTFVPSRGGS